MIGIRSTLPACNCMNRLYDRGIYRRIKTELPSSVNDVPIDEVNLGCTSPFEVLQHRCLRVAVAIQDFNEPNIIRFSRNTSSVPSRWNWIDKHLLWSDSALLVLPRELRRTFYRTTRVLQADRCTHASSGPRSPLSW